MTINKSESRRGIAISGLTAENGSNVLVCNTDYSIIASEKQKQNLLAAGLLIIIIIPMMLMMIFASQRWMNLPTAMQAFVPAAKSDFDKKSKERADLEAKLAIAKRNLAVKTNILNVASSDDQKEIDDLQTRINITKGEQQRFINIMVNSLIYKLKSGEIIAKGLDQQNQWVCLLPSDWQEGLKLSGTLTQTFITGGGSGRLISVMFGKPRAEAVPNPDRLCQGAGPA